MSLSIFADRAPLRGQLRDDAMGAGLHVIVEATLEALVWPGDPAPPDQALGEVVLVDCPVVDAAAMAGLARLDMRAARDGTRLIVSTSVAALDDVFGCMDRSDPQLLVDPDRGERMVALGEALARVSRSGVRELTQEDRLAVLRLTEQVGQIAQRLDWLTPPRGPGQIGGQDTNLFRYEPQDWHEPEVVRATLPAWRHEPAQDLARAPILRDATTLPDPRLVRRIIRQRQLRGRFLDPELFADPAWDMLLDLTAAAGERARVSVSSLCIAAMVPPTTALRWIRQMTDTGLLARSEDSQDRRRAFITLTDRSKAAMVAFFSELDEGAAAAV